MELLNSYIDYLRTFILGTNRMHSFSTYPSIKVATEISTCVLGMEMFISGRGKKVSSKIRNTDIVC